MGKVRAALALLGIVMLGLSGGSVPNSRLMAAQPEEVWDFCATYSWSDPSYIALSGVFQVTPENDRLVSAAFLKAIDALPDYVSNGRGCDVYRAGSSRAEAVRLRENRIRQAHEQNWRIAYIQLPDLPFVTDSGPSGGGSGASGPPSSNTPEHRAAVEAEVARLGPHRRAEAERLVTMREQADAARRRNQPPGAAAAPSPTPRPTAAATPFVMPQLPKTNPPPGFVDRIEESRTGMPTAAEAERRLSARTQCDNGPPQILAKQCFVYNSEHYCQATVRCPLAKGPSGARRM